MKTYQQYITDKEAAKRESFILAVQTMQALDRMDAAERDEDWDDYRQLITTEVNRLALELPVLFVKRIYEESQS
jgi:hypothetical protein